MYGRVGKEGLGTANENAGLLRSGFGGRRRKGLRWGGFFQDRPPNFPGPGHAGTEAEAIAIETRQEKDRNFNVFSGRHALAIFMSWSLNQPRK
jgi:hypothetical protein